MVATEKTGTTIKAVAQPAAYENKSVELLNSGKIKNSNHTIDGDWNQLIPLNEIRNLRSKKDFSRLLIEKNINPRKFLETLEYEAELEALQIELVRLQHWVQDTGARIAILFEGRDAAGKGGAIRRFIEHLNPRAMRVVALPKPTEEERGQWYFQRYTKQLPNQGELVFFDRSWYNRAVVEPVNNFCTSAQYEVFMKQVTEFEHLLYHDGITLIKFWFSISKEEQIARFKSRMQNPLKQWKISSVDLEAQKKWDQYTQYKEQMLTSTHTSYSPWVIVQANNKQKARLESIRYVLSRMEYTDKSASKVSLIPRSDIIGVYSSDLSTVDH